MCGITGYLSFSPEHVRPGELAASVASLSHRGPDGSGVWEKDAGVGLGHTRLSILDLSTHASQPMESADGHDVIVFNGEIYNFRDIRRELISLGHAFQGTGDTEVVLASLRQWGTGAVTKFIGMFAIAWWNRDRQELVLIRDRLGVKPLYYAWDGKLFWFGSELKALQPFGAWRREIDPDAVRDFLQYGYISAPYSIYRNVRKLQPGHWLKIDRKCKQETHAYWKVPDATENDTSRSEDELEQELEALLVDAFRLRMVSDVPVGVFLSGGVDSSLVAALLAREQTGLHTFTMGFHEKAFDESPHAALVATHLKTHHSSEKISEADALAILPQWGRLFDEPFGDATGIPNLLVSRLARRHAKVVLSADGGDELFSGYAAYAGAMQRQAALDKIPAFLGSMLSGANRLGQAAGLGGMLSSLPGQWRDSVWWKCRHVLPLLSGAPFGKIYEGVISQWLPDEIDRLTGTEHRNPRVSADAFKGDCYQRMSAWDLRYYLPDDILAKVDRCTMSEGIEGREPLLDHRLVEFSMSLPTRYKRGALGSKHILRRILYRHVPRDLVDRPKQGFSVPMAKWLQRDLGGLLDTYLNPDRLREAGLLDARETGALLRRFRSGMASEAQRVWLLLAFQMWSERWHE